MPFSYYDVSPGFLGWAIIFILFILGCIATRVIYNRWEDIRDTRFGQRVEFQRRRWLKRAPGKKLKKADKAESTDLKNKENNVDESTNPKKVIVNSWFNQTKEVLSGWIKKFKALPTGKKVRIVISSIISIVLAMLAYELIALVAFVLLCIVVKNVSGWRKAAVIVMILFLLVYLVSNIGSITVKVMSVMLLSIIVSIIVWFPANFILFVLTLCSGEIRTWVLTHFQSRGKVVKFLEFIYFWPTVIQVWWREMKKEKDMK